MSGVIRTSGKKTVIRESYRSALAELGRENEKIVVLDADLAATTKAGIFKEASSERHIDCGIAECNMIGIAAGPATTGMVPFASSFVMPVAGRASEQVRNSIGYPHPNVKTGTTHTGISIGEDGMTHQCNEDITLMRAIPGIVVIRSSDDMEAKAVARTAAEYDGPVCLRFGRLAMPVIDGRENYNFTTGKRITLRGNKDVTIVTTDLLVSSALEAVALLEKNGIGTEVINIHTIKSPGEELITTSVGKTDKVVTVEKRPIIEGLGGAVYDVPRGSCPVPVRKIGMQDQFDESGPAMELVHRYELNGEGICTQVKEYLG